MTVSMIGVHPERLDIAVHAGGRIDFTVDAAALLPEGSTSLAGWSVSVRARPDRPGADLVDLPATLAGLAVRVVVTGAMTAEWCSTWSGLSAQWDLALISPDAELRVLRAGWLHIYPTLPRDVTPPPADLFPATFAPTF